VRVDTSHDICHGGKHHDVTLAARRLDVRQDEGCASIPRASPTTAMMVVRTIPSVRTDLRERSVSWGFQPLLELSADRVSQAAMVVRACAAVAYARKSANVSTLKRGFLILSSLWQRACMKTWKSHCLRSVAVLCASEFALCTARGRLPETRVLINARLATYLSTARLTMSPLGHGRPLLP
jgi:hypothetical protein